MRARGRSPSSRARAAVITSTAAAPSVICDDDARGVHAVLARDRLELGQRLERRLAQAFVARDVVRRAGRLAFLVDVGRVDRQHLALEAAFGPRPLRALSATRGRTASQSARVMPHLSAMRSAPSNCDVSS